MDNTTVDSTGWGWTFYGLFLLALLSFSSCTNTASLQASYDPASNISSFASKRVVMGYRDMSAGLATNQRIMWQAQASCTGESCVPEEIALVFFNDTSGNLNLDYRGLQIIVDGKTHSWKDITRQTEPANFRVPAGEFTRVSLSLADFQQLAEAQKVDLFFGETGTSTFNVAHGRRAEFRTFIALLRAAK